MRSEHDINLLYDYVNGLLSDNEKAAFEKQLANSLDLQNDLKRVQQYYSLVKSSEPSEVPRDFVDTIHRKIGIFKELPDNGVSPESLATAPERSECGSNQNRPVSADLQEKYKNTNRLQPRFKRWFSFEAVGVLATAAILVFIVIPNVNIPERAKKTMHNEPLLQKTEEKSNGIEPQLTDESKPVPDGDLSMPVVTSDKIKAADNERLSVNTNDEMKRIPKKAVAQSPAKGTIARAHVAQNVSSSPVPSASPSMSGSSVTSAVNETTLGTAPDELLKEIPALSLPVPSAVMSSRAPDEPQSNKPVRIVMTAAMEQELNEAPLSVQTEAKMMKSRRSDRINRNISKNDIEKSENTPNRSANAETATGAKIEKNDLETMFSVHGIVWKCLHQESGKLLYSLSGSTKDINSLFKNLALRGFITKNSPVFSNDSLIVELELDY